MYSQVLQMRTLAILPIKSFGAAKTRLAGLLGSGSRQAVAQAMFCDTLSSLRRVPGLDAIAVVTSDRVAEMAAVGSRVLLLRDDREAGHSAAAEIGIRHAVATGYERVLLVPGDTPLLDPNELAGLLERGEAEQLGVAIVPDRHGTGTNGLLIAPPDGFSPSFGEDSLRRHLDQAESRGLRFAVAPLASLTLDVDTPDDLAEVSEALEQRRGLAPLTRGALKQLDRSQVRPTTRPRTRAAA
jgi:2-phospho-L-lactate/phosphoenolpyruvate guanylyltransferase